MEEKRRQRNGIRRGVLSGGVREEPPDPMEKPVPKYAPYAYPVPAGTPVDVYEQRKRTGVELAKESPASADMVIPVPDSSIPAAIGYAIGFLFVLACASAAIVVIVAVGAWKEKRKIVYLGAAAWPLPIYFSALIVRAMLAS